ncbi:MAG: pyridoxamine 5'-phosphate oxidase family protein [Balneolia bacterium]|nr:pyridoxamine 5'-phosphate oxidase family protein [Balneolia bacterium]
MLNEKKSEDENWQEIIGWIRRGSVDVSHPFRYLTLSTSDEAARIQSRMLVLREVTENNKLILYTDSRSAKISQIQNNAEAGVLFWDPKRKVQLSLSVTVKQIDDKDSLKRYRDKVNGKARESYTTKCAPGTPVDHPDEAGSFHEFEETNFFTVLECDIHRITALQLGREKHLRLNCERKADSWECSWVVP